MYPFVIAPALRNFIRNLHNLKSRSSSIIIVPSNVNMLRNSTQTLGSHIMSYNHIIKSQLFVHCFNTFCYRTESFTRHSVDHLNNSIMDKKNIVMSFTPMCNLIFSNN